MMDHVFLLMFSALFCTTLTHYSQESLDLYNDPNFGVHPVYDYSINKNIFALAANSNMIYHSRGRRPTIEVHNIGRGTIVVTDGSCCIWRSIINVHPWSKRVFRGKILCPLNYLKISNTHPFRAIVALSGGSETIGNPPDDYDKIKTLKKAFTLGVRNINVDNGLVSLISTFWPKRQPNVWKQLLETLSTLLDVEFEASTNAILDGDLKQIENNILDLQKRVMTTTDRAGAFMKVVEDLVDFEKKFLTSGDDYSMMNDFYILPLYANIVTMKIHFYTIGIVNSTFFQLDERQQERIRQFTFNTLFGTNLDGAIGYIRKISIKVIDNIYSTVYPGGLYNVLMVARTHIALHGLEMIPIWKKAYTEPDFDTRALIDVISYSNFYGTATDNLFQQATPMRVQEPLTPHLQLLNVRIKLLEIIVHLNTIDLNQPGGICGLELNFETHYKVLMGTPSKEVQILKLDGRTITKLTVYGGATVARLEFGLSDQTTRIFGVMSDTRPEVFELEDHHIVSLYVANDVALTGLDLDNVAVSFSRNH